MRSPSRLLIVDDHEAFRRFIRVSLQQRSDFQVVGEALDGLEAVQKAQELRPDLVLLDIGLPKLNGFEAAQQIRRLAPQTRLLFISQMSSAEVVREAFHLGAMGYVHKSQAHSDLLPAVETVLGDKRFVSSGLEFNEDITGADVTELERADEVRLRYAAIVESSDDAIIAKTLQGVISAWNPAAQRMFGFTQEEALGQPITIIIPPDLHAQEEDILRKLRAGERIEHLETRRISKTGKTIHVSLTVSPIKDAEGRIIGASKIARDITERRRSEESLRRSQGYVSQAERLAHSGSWAWDARTRETFWSREMFRILGYDPEKTRPSLTDFLARVHPEDRLRAEQRLREEASGRDVNSDYRIVLPDGTIRHIQAIGHPIKNESGEVVEVVGTTVDVTERKLAEETLSRVGGRLIEAHEQERSRLARELHDDINQRIALLGVTLQGLKQGPPTSPEELREQIAKVSEQIEEVGKGIQALSHRLHSPKLELLGLAATAASFCRELSDQQGVKIEFHAEKVPKELSEDIGLCLFRILQEALQNAVKHSGSRHFHVLLLGGPSEVELTVHDSGCGFDVEEAIRGRGLGLTSMRERLKLVNGEISIESQLQCGTTIQVSVPFNTRTKSAGTVG